MKKISTRVWWISLGLEVLLIILLSIFAIEEKPAMSEAQKRAEERLLNSLAAEKQLLGDQKEKGNLTSAFVSSEDENIDEQAAEHQAQL
jgi:hypothetical protein